MVFFGVIAVYTTDRSYLVRGRGGKYIFGWPGKVHIWYVYLVCIRTSFFCCNNERWWIDRVDAFLTHHWIFNPAGCFTWINIAPVVPGMRIVVNWHIFWAIVGDRIVFIFPPARQCRTKPRDQGEGYIGIRLILSTSDHTSITNERTAVAYEQNICCFWERLTRKFEI